MSKYSDKKRRMVREGVVKMDFVMGEGFCEESGLAVHARSQGVIAPSQTAGRKPARSVWRASDGIACAIRAVVDTISALDDAVSGTRISSRASPLAVRNSLNAIRLKLTRLQARVLEFEPGVGRICPQR